MLKLILDIVPLVVIFACGYSVRDWMSGRRRKEARKRYYERHPAIPKPEAHAPKIETKASAKNPLSGRFMSG
jgi:hypothetical protein